MQAVILAGGKGTRLRPLTTNTPKPMVPLFDKPVMEHCIDLLKKHEVTDITVTVSYLAHEIMDYFGDGSRWGVKIRYSIEDSPRGTAGGVKLVQPYINDTFVVISGDAATDFDLSSALDYHREKSAIATLLLYEVDDPSEFGVVACDRAGKVTRFLEKPKAHEAFTNTVNTGIYIMEPEALSSIPYDTVFDFSRDLFPRFLRNQDALYGCRLDGYWCDIGNLIQYRNAHFDALTGRIKLEMKGQQIDEGVFLGEGVEMDESARIMGPAYIGSGSQIREGAVIGAFSVVGDASLIEEDVSISRSVLGRYSQIGRSTSIRGSVIARGQQLVDHLQVIDRVLAEDENQPLGTGCDSRLTAVPSGKWIPQINEQAMAA